MSAGAPPPNPDEEDRQLIRQLQRSYLKEALQEWVPLITAGAAGVVAFLAMMALDSHSPARPSTRPSGSPVSLVFFVAGGVYVAMRSLMGSRKD